MIKLMLLLFCVRNINKILLNKMGVSLDEQKVHVIYNSERQMSEC